MQLANAPSKLTTAFAASGNKHVIPVPSQIPITPGAASWTDGFPPLTMIAPAQGGQGVSGLDTNGILNALSALDIWFNAGGAYAYDATFAAAIGGYPKGARILIDGVAGYWQSLVDNNMSNPNTFGPGWIPQGGNNTSSVYASTQQTIAVGGSKIFFDTVEFDSGFWDLTHQRFVATYPGKYRMSGAILLSAPGGQNIASVISKNGVGAKQCFEAPQVSDGNLTIPFDAILNCVTGDFLEVVISITQTPVLVGAVGSNQAFVFAQLEYLGT